MQAREKAWPAMLVIQIVGKILLQPAFLTWCLSPPPATQADVLSQLRLQEKQVFPVHRFRYPQAHGPKEFRPLRGWRQVIVADRTTDFVVKGVQLRAADKVQHQELSAGLQMAGDLPQRHRLVAEVGKRMEAQHHVELALNRSLAANVHEDKIGVHPALSCLCQHGRGKVRSHNLARLHQVSQPTCNLARTAADLQHIEARS